MQSQQQKFYFYCNKYLNCTGQLADEDLQELIKQLLKEKNNPALETYEVYFSELFNPKEKKHWDKRNAALRDVYSRGELERPNRDETETQFFDNKIKI